MSKESPEAVPLLESSFNSSISRRFNLWQSIIDDSVATEQIKVELKQALNHFRGAAFTDWVNLDDAFHGTVNRLLTITAAWEKGDNDPGDLKALFENLRDDIWELRREIQ